MDEQYVDAFFDTGSLRLSSFLNFISSNDAERFDDKEGETMLVAKTEELGGQTLSAMYTCKNDAYVLCGSTEYSNSQKSKFGRGCIQINDTIAFAQEVSKCIEGFIGGLEGPCFYQNKKIVEKDLGFIPVEKLMDPIDPTKLNKQEILKWLNMVGGNDVYFLKPLRYIGQSEYRFIWRLDRENTKELDISCPEARNFCQRPSAWVGTDDQIEGSPRCLVPLEADSITNENTEESGIAFPGNWRRRHAICFPPAHHDLENFSIRLTRGAFNDEILEPNGPYAAQADGGDIRFSLDKEGEKGLPADVIKFGHDSHRGARDSNIDIRVKVPVVPSANCLTLFVWYQSSPPVAQPEATSPMGRLNAYDDSWENYHPEEEDSSRLYDRK